MVIELDTAALAHRVHVLEAAGHLLFTAMLAGTEDAVLKRTIMGLCQAGMLWDEEAEALIAEIGLEEV